MRRRGTSVESHISGVLADPHLLHGAAAPKVQGARQPQQQNRLLHAGPVRGINRLHGRFFHRGPRLSQIARDGRDDAPLLRRVTQNLRVRNNVVGMPVMAVAVHVVSHLIKHGGRRQPLAKFRRQPVHRTQRRE